MVRSISRRNANAQPGIAEKNLRSLSAKNLRSLSANRRPPPPRIFVKLFENVGIFRGKLRNFWSRICPRIFRNFVNPPETCWELRGIVGRCFWICPEISRNFVKFPEMLCPEAFARQPLTSLSLSFFERPRAAQVPGNFRSGTKPSANEQMLQCRRCPCRTWCTLASSQREIPL